MLINVTGCNKHIPGINKLPPIKNYQADEALVRNLLMFGRYWKVYDAESGRLITESNIDDFYPISINCSTSGGGDSNPTTSWKVL